MPSKVLIKKRGLARRKKSIKGKLTIGKYPRLINLKKIGVSNISEMKNNIKIKKTIDQVIFDEG